MVDRAPAQSPTNPAPTTYGNASFVLPGYTTLKGYVDVPGSKSGETDGAQVPITSWTADGVFYVNATDDLVFYNFATSGVTRIASWTPLFENLMNYNGVTNTEYLTQDGSEVYAIGCATSCQGTPQPSVEFEVANVSTGAVWTYIFAGLTYSTEGGLGETRTNVEPFLIGVNGSDNEAVVVDDTGVVYGVPVGSPGSVVPAELTGLPYFEASNLEWMPTLNSFINEEAGGDIHDRWAQLQWNGASFQVVASGTWGNDTVSNFANAGGYNLTAGEWSITAGACSTHSVVYGYLPIVGGVAGAFHANADPDATDSCPYTPPFPPLARGANLGVEGGGSDRVPLTAAGPFVAFQWNNTSAILNPVTGEWDTLGAAASPGIYGPSATYSTANLFHNGSYLVSPRSGTCVISCSLLGEAGASSLGTEWWLWNEALPEFPYPGTSPLDEPAAPGAPVLTAASPTATTASVSWSEPASSGPLLNFTLCWSSTSRACTHWVPLMPWAQNYTITGLVPDGEVNVSVFALNYHYFGLSGSISIRTLHVAVHQIQFTETGLPGGSNWSVALDGAPVNSTDDQIRFVVENGTYDFAVTPLNGFNASPVSGVVRVSGSDVNRTISYSAIAPLRLEASWTNLTVSDECGPLAGVVASVRFIANVTGGVPPYGFSWRFGDGSPPSSVEDPVHTYHETGAQVNITVDDSRGGEASSAFHVSWPLALCLVPPLPSLAPPLGGWAILALGSSVGLFCAFARLVRRGERRGPLQLRPDRKPALVLLAARAPPDSGPPPM